MSLREVELDDTKETELRRQLTVVDLQMNLRRRIPLLDHFQARHQLPNVIRDSISIWMSSFVSTERTPDGKDPKSAPVAVEAELLRMEETRKDAHVNDLVAQQLLITRNHQDRAQSTQVTPARRNVRMGKLSVRCVELDLTSLRNEKRERSQLSIRRVETSRKERSVAKGEEEEGRRVRTIVTIFPSTSRTISFPSVGSAVF